MWFMHQATRILIIDLHPTRKSTTNDLKERINQPDDRIRSTEMSLVSAVRNNKPF